MNCNRWWMVASILTALPCVGLAQAQKKRDAIVIYKDGFYIQGKITEQVGEVIYDRGSGRAFPVLSGDFFIDDQVRQIRFSPGQVQKVIQLKASEVKEAAPIVRIKARRQTHEFLPTWVCDDVSKFDEKGERSVQVRKGTATYTLTQRLGLLSPRYLGAISGDFRMTPMFYPQEIDPATMRKILLQVFREVPEFKRMGDSGKYMRLAAFMQEAGWFEQAEKELVAITASFPSERKVAAEMLTRLHKQRAEAAVERIEKAASVGQHGDALERLAIFERQGAEKLVAPASRLKILDLKAKYAKSKTDIEQAQKYLTEFPDLVSSNKKTWAGICSLIRADLNHDTIGRLETFLLFAEQFQTNRKANKKQQQGAEQVLALAASGWLQGDSSALADVPNALKLVRARTFLLKYLRDDDDSTRVNQISSFKKDADLGLDVLIRLVRMIPPAHAHDAKKINTKPQTIEMKIGDGGSYVVQLPPDYHHLRSYPVLLVLHGGGDGAEETLTRFSADAAKQGFILAAPKWTGGNLVKARRHPTVRDQTIVLDTLRDLRRRFNIDSDRVFLFGFQEGATLAFDLALSQPDLFAGAAPMCGYLPTFTRRFYWPNAQYLPFYVVEGQRNGANAKYLRELFKNHWSHEPFASIYVEYKDRASEWYSLEVGRIMTWMSHKKRHSPLREVGRRGIGGAGEEFQSTRSGDNRFYWLSTQAIEDRCQGDHGDLKWRNNFKPASFQASLSIGNKLAQGGAKIWNHASLRVHGVKQITLWIPHGTIMDLTKPLSLNVNGQPVGGMRPIAPSLELMLDQLYQTGDRQRLFVAKFDINIK